MTFFLRYQTDPEMKKVIPKSAVTIRGKPAKCESVSRTEGFVNLVVQHTYYEVTNSNFVLASLTLIVISHTP